MSNSDNDQRLERLIAAQEAHTNATIRLVQLLEEQLGKKRARAKTKQRRVVTEKPIVVTPLVEAAASRALARIRGR